MTDQESIAQLEAENAAKDRQIAHLREQVAALDYVLGNENQSKGSYNRRSWAPKGGGSKTQEEMHQMRA